MLEVVVGGFGSQVLPDGRSFRAMALDAAVRSEQLLTVWRILRRRLRRPLAVGNNVPDIDHPGSRSFHFRQRHQIRLHVGNRLVAGVELAECGHDAPRLPHRLFELVIGQASTGEIRPKPAFSRLAMTAPAPPFVPSSLAGSGITGWIVRGLHQRRKEQSKSYYPHAHSPMNRSSLVGNKQRITTSTFYSETSTSAPKHGRFLQAEPDTRRADGQPPAGGIPRFC